MLEKVVDDPGIVLNEEERLDVMDRPGSVLEVVLESEAMLLGVAVVDVTDT